MAPRQQHLDLAVQRLALSTNAGGIAIGHPCLYMHPRRPMTIETRFAGTDVPRPEFWGGYRLVPDRIEFWRSQDSRLHDRLVYVREGDAFRRERLYP